MKLSKAKEILIQQNEIKALEFRNETLNNTCERLETLYIQSQRGCAFLEKENKKLKEELRTKMLAVNYENVSLRDILDKLELKELLEKNVSFLNKKQQQS